ncbi:AraC family transcriptional regulator [Micromonospora sp. NBC_00421]|uniref:AraC family transcriptional regulator n=1 Tax=Micromonospora sp. NBC_00421 TaxID=2975976 RepID=UPI002E21D756
MDADPEAGVKTPPWQRFTLTDVDEVRAFFRATFADISVLHESVGPEGVELQGMGLALGDVALTGLRYSAGIRVAGVARDLVNIIQVRAGRLVVADSRDSYRVTPGHVALIPADVTLELECDALESFTVGLPTTLLDEVARGGEGGDPVVRFEGIRPRSTGLERHWLGTLAYVQQVVLADADLIANPLIVGQVRHMLATAALAVFPCATTVPRQRAPANLSPAVVRRAMDYVDAHIDRYVSLVELAGAAGVSARGLQYAFRRYQDTTPARYARRVRLERAHQDLLDGDPANGDTVTAIAARWGFTDAKRFATDYRAAYGQPPSHTLRA